MSYLEQLGRELAAAGIPGRRRRRILAEIEDHLACDPRADLGDPAALATQFADELGTALALRAALRGFGALAVAGALLALGFLSGVRLREIDPPAAWLLLLGPQVALVSGALALIRALRRRRAPVIAAAEATILVRRAGVGLAGGLAAMAGLAMAAEVRSGSTLLLAAGSAGAVVLLAAAPSVIAAGRLRPVAPGPAGDLFEDLGPLVPAPLRGHPWRFALLVAGGLAVVIALAGVIQSDPFDGAARALADGLACLAGFGLLGRFLGLR